MGAVASCCRTWRSASGAPGAPLQCGQLTLQTGQASRAPRFPFVSLASPGGRRGGRPWGSTASAARLPFGGSVSCREPPPLMDCVQKYCKQSLFKIEPEPPSRRDCLVPRNVKMQNNLWTGLKQHRVPKKCLQRQQKSRYCGHWTDDYITENYRHCLASALREVVNSNRIRGGTNEALLLRRGTQKRRLLEKTFVLYVELNVLWAPRILRGGEERARAPPTAAPVWPRPSAPSLTGSLQKKASGEGPPTSGWTRSPGALASLGPQR